VAELGAAGLARSPAAPAVPAAAGPNRGAAGGPFVVAGWAPWSARPR